MTTKRIKPGDSGMLAKAPEGGGDYGGTCGCDYEDSSGPKFLTCLGGGGLHTGRG